MTDSRAALVVAHPGHELRAYGWLRENRPLTSVFTDGSGSKGEGRLDSCSQILGISGALPGAIYGRCSDREFYTPLLEGRHDYFCGLADELCSEWKARDIQVVAGDAIEGYNSMHDACRLVIDAAVEKLRRQTGRVLASYDFQLVGLEMPACEQPESLLRYDLDEAAWQEKIDLARRFYPYVLTELEKSQNGTKALEALRTEWLRPVASRFQAAQLDENLDGFLDKKPFYETYGERQVAAGHYKYVIRYQEHILPLMHALHRSVQTPMA